MKTFNNEQILKLQTGVTDLLAAIGDDPDRSGVIETPERVVKAHAEIFAHTGETQFSDYKLFDTTQDADMVVVEGIPFYSMCEHHMLPFFGKAHVAYIPDGGRIIGLSKIPRLVNYVSRKLSVQENITHDIADILTNILKPKGVAVLVEGRHMCVEMRGVKKVNSLTKTSYFLGEFKENSEKRMEFLESLL